jgi:hypothetical protein
VGSGRVLWGKLQAGSVEVAARWQCLALFRMSLCPWASFSECFGISSDL